MATDWEDDWENTEIHDLIVNLEDTLKNKERELRLLAERKMMEEADLALTEDLFNQNEYKNVSLEPVKFIKNVKLNHEAKKIPHQNKNQEYQKQESQRKKAKKLEQKRMKDLYGEAEVDKYDELYGDIEDKYY